MNAIKPYLWLIGIGASWGITQPLTKVAVNGGLEPFGLIFWQLFLGALVLCAVLKAQNKPVPLSKTALCFFVAIAFIGTIIPNAAGNKAYQIVPSSIMSLFLSLIPIFAFPIALSLGNDRFSWRRLIGLTIGLCGALVIIGVPAALPAQVTWLFVALGILPSLMYAFEGNFVARFGTGGSDPIQLLAGASIVGSIVAFPLAIGTGQYFNPIELDAARLVAVFAISVIHAIVYTCYVSVVTWYGPVFSVQVSYLVTLFGLFWAGILLNETLSGSIGIALILIFAGIYLVTPRNSDPSPKPYKS